MKTLKSIIAVAAVSLFAAGLAFAADEKKDATASVQAGCCAKAEKAGEKCTHSCCVDAAKAGNNCTTCKGSGKIEKKPADAKK